MSRCSGRRRSGHVPQMTEAAVLLALAWAVVLMAMVVAVVMVMAMAMAMVTAIVIMVVVLAVEAVTHLREHASCSSQGCLQARARSPPMVRENTARCAGRHLLSGVELWQIGPFLVCLRRWSWEVTTSGVRRVSESLVTTDVVRDQSLSH